MKSKLLKSIVSLTVVAALTVIPAGVSQAGFRAGTARAAQGAAVVESKNEVIYANLAADGGAYAVYVVNQFEVSQPGSVTDHGDYATVVNLTDTGALTRQGNAVVFDAPQGNFYYQGNRKSVDLPWLLAVSYSLDGVKMPPQELAGKNGKLEIHITSGQNGKVDPTFYSNYMLQVSLTLDGEKCGDLTAPGATVARAGKNIVVAHTVMPGKNADITVSATVQDFEMAGIDITAMPFSMSVELPDTDDMLEDFEALTEAIADLNDGVGELEDGVAELKSGINKLKDSSLDIKQGLSQLSGNSRSMTDASAQIKSALAQITSSLDSGALAELDLDDLAQLPQGLTQMAQGLRGVSGGLVSLKNGFTPAYGALDTAMQGIPNVVLTQAQITDLYANTDPSQHGVLDDLLDAYAAGQTAKGTYSSVKAAFDAVGSTIDRLTGSIDTIAAKLEQMAAGIGATLAEMDGLDQLSQLATGLSELSANYGKFHSGLTKYLSGLNALAKGYPDFHSGMAAFSQGVGDLREGVAELHDGTGQLADETADLPQTMQAEIDKLLEEYTGSDFAPVSFTSPENGNIDLVQFVLKCEGIKKQDGTGDAAAPAADEITIWERFTALFGGKRE